MLLRRSAPAALGPRRDNSARQLAPAARALPPRLVAQLRAAAAASQVAESAGLGSTDGGVGSVASVDSEPVVPEKLPWHKKPCAFKELNSVEELEAVISPANNQGRMTVVDFYAGWCACCKSSYVTLCRIPSKPELQGKFQFFKANVEVDTFASLIKKKGVRGIPHVLIFDKHGNDLIGMGASFKKMEVLRKNLEYIAKSDKQSFTLDPNGFVIDR